MLQNILSHGPLLSNLNRNTLSHVRSVWCSFRVRKICSTSFCDMSVTILTRLWNQEMFFSHAKWIARDRNRHYLVGISNQTNFVNVRESSLWISRLLSIIMIMITEYFYWLLLNASLRKTIRNHIKVKFISILFYGQTKLDKLMSHNQGFKKNGVSGMKHFYWSNLFVYITIQNVTKHIKYFSKASNGPKSYTQQLTYI